MKPLQSRLLLSACLLVVSLGPALAASCSPRMSPLRCLFASLHALRSPPHALTRHAARPKAVTRTVRARPGRRGPAARVAWVGHRRGRSLAPAAIAAGVAPSLAAAAPTLGADPPPNDPALASPVPAPRDRAAHQIALIGAAPATEDEPPASNAEPAGDPETPAATATGQDAAASAGVLAARIAAPEQDGAPEGRLPAVAARLPAAGGVPARPPDETSIRRLFGLSGEPSAAASGPLVGGAAQADIELRPLPAAFVELRPYLADLRYFIAGDRVVLVLPETRLVVMTY